MYNSLFLKFNIYFSQEKFHHHVGLDIFVNTIKESLHLIRCPTSSFLSLFVLTFIFNIVASLEEIAKLTPSSSISKGQSPPRSFLSNLIIKLNKESSEEETLNKRQKVDKV